MKRLTFLVFLLISSNVFSQKKTDLFSAKDFEKEVLAYTPQQGKEVTKEKFDYASMILSETKKAIKGNPDNFSLPDYFNILSAFISLQLSEKDINTSFDKFISAKGSCEYLIAFEQEVNKNPKYDVIRKRYEEELQKCKGTSTVTNNDIEKYIKEHSYSAELLRQMNTIQLKDQQYRDGDLKNWAELQTPVDLKNQKAIDSLYKIHKVYIGKSLVGERFQSAMWAVIQHSNLEMMERYLPVVDKAVKTKDVPQANLKMLIDRIYSIKYKTQVFGSQGAVKMADEKVRQEVIKRYSLL